jgi:alanyl-tRNA synthetase
MTSAEIRNGFLKYFEERSHTIVSSSPVIPFEDPTLLFKNAGMNQFKDVFLGMGKRQYTRAADTQKCIRVSGKHNDLEEVGRDTYHHTFFEMLGNWSFGDYYKKEAIQWAWELLTKVWALPKDRLWATVYTNDDEADILWKTVTDIDPSHVLRFGEKDNFWEMGETGPCGPCSEIHIDRTPNRTATAEMVNAGLAEVMEIWNLVFIQYNRDEAGTLHPLPSKHVDTGMGFERMCAVLQGKQSNYDTDVFTPIIQRISAIVKKPYDGKIDGSITAAQQDLDTAMRVIADHVRTLTFAIGDGAVPSNEGRGYVLRRILRRAARFGRNLGMHEPFIHQLVPTLSDVMSYIFPEINTQREHIQRVIKGEEESFNATLDRGLERFEAVIQQVGSSKMFPGEDAFKLYDTFGFPLDLTELMASERGLTVDVGMFNALMEEQKERSRESRSVTATSAGETDAIALQISAARDTARSFDTSALSSRPVFVGYEMFESKTEILSAKGNLVVLRETPFYGESGGQVGDTGEIVMGAAHHHVLDTQKSGEVMVHLLDAPSPTSGEALARVDVSRRNSIMRNHSATHLLHNALRRILGTHVHQAGSLVAADSFRFDFAHFAKLTEAELTSIESLVNEKIHENIAITHHRNIPFEEAKKLGALMFFGDKYGDRVNVVQFGEFSKEFCGGTHVRATGDIGYLKIRSEGSVASGVRRIEAVTGEHALLFLQLLDRTIDERITLAEGQLQTLVATESELQKGSGKRPGTLLFAEFEKTLAGLKKKMILPVSASHVLAPLFDGKQTRQRAVEDLILRMAEIQKGLDRELVRSRMTSLSGSIDDLVKNTTDVNGVRVIGARIQVASVDELKSLGDTLRARLPGGVGLLATVLDDKVQLVCVVSDDLVASKRVDAGKVVGIVAKLLGGGGGGRPHMATAGGKDVGKLDEVLTNLPSIVASVLK